MKFRKFRNHSSTLAALAAAFIGFLVAGEASAATLCVNKAGTGGCYTTIQAAVTAAAPGDTIVVAPDPVPYTEPMLVIDKKLSLRGAKYGVSPKWRSFGSANESTVNGVITILAAGVKINGFSITAPPAADAFGILVKSTGSGAVISRNIIEQITATGAAQAIYLENGPDHVCILDNAISLISGDQSTKGIFIGDSTSANPSRDIVIEDNKISDIYSASKGAYGILANNGASLDPAAIGYTEVEIRDNVIKYLSGNWAHAIGLEGDTPFAIVDDNTISHLFDESPPMNGIADEIAVFFEDNKWFASAMVNLNRFNSVTIGIAVSSLLRWKGRRHVQLVGFAQWARRPTAAGRWSFRKRKWTSSPG